MPPIITVRKLSKQYNPPEEVALYPQLSDCQNLPYFSQLTGQRLTEAS
jgi:hypothetical protein